jgi:phospholipid/cholesterol/gamma-HCH transport system ATP-binding protein
VVFRDLELAIYPGETLTVLGSSGSGKSVALKLLIGLLDCDGGSITFHGDEVTTMDRQRIAVLRRKIGMLFQASALFDSISVGDNVAYGIREHLGDEPMTVHEVVDRVSWALSLVGLPGIEAMMPAELSGGMKKRVGLARAIAMHPEVLLYDEPTTGLDPINTERIAHVIAGLKEKLRVTNIVVTHDLKTAFALSDRLALIYNGEVICAGSPDEFRASNDPRVHDFITGTAPTDEDVQTLLRA